MAIRKRPPTDPVAQAAAIEAFGAAAESPSSPAEPRRRPSPTAQGRGANDPWPGGLAKTLLIRYPDPEMPALLEELARLEDRSQHSTAVRALRRGLEALRDEAR